MLNNDSVHLLFKDGSQKLSRFKNGAKHRFEFTFWEINCVWKQFEYCTNNYVGEQYWLDNNMLVINLDCQSTNLIPTLWNTADKLRGRIYMNALADYSSITKMQNKYTPINYIKL